MRVVALDPGGTTGMAAFLPLGDGWRVGAWQCGPDAAARSVWNLARAGAIDLIATEGFRIRSGTPVSAATGIPLLVNGALNLVSMLHDIALVEISPTDRAGALRRMRARSVGWAGTGPHAHDAQAVGLCATGADAASLLVLTGGPIAVGWENLVEEVL